MRIWCREKGQITDGNLLLVWEEGEIRLILSLFLLRLDGDVFKHNKDIESYFTERARTFVYNSG